MELLQGKRTSQSTVEVIRDLWQKLQITNGKVWIVISPLKQYPDFFRMSADEARKKVMASPFSEREKQELMKLRSNERLKRYQELMTLHELKEADKARLDFHNYFVLNRIFVEFELAARFSTLSQAFVVVLQETADAHESRDYKVCESHARNFVRVQRH